MKLAEIQRWPQVQEDGRMVSVTFVDAELRALAVCLAELDFEKVDAPTERGSVVLDVFGGDISEWVVFRDKLREVRRHGALSCGDALTPVAEPMRNIPPGRVLAAVSKHYDVSIPMLKGRRGVRSVSHARMVGMYLMRELTSLSLPEIGKQFGGRDHSTVLHGIGKIGALSLELPEFRAELAKIMAMVMDRALG